MDRADHSFEATRRRCARRSLLALALLALGLSGPATAQTIPPIGECELVPVPGPAQVQVDTPLGTMLLELYPNVAPRTVLNFLRYIQRGDYEGTVVHRAPTPAFVIQAGGYAAPASIFLEQIETVAPVPNEPCLSNVQGTIAMARLDNQPNSATSQWFVNLVDNSAVLDAEDGGFTVFGRVVEGFAVAQAIQALDRTTDVVPAYLGEVEPQLFAILEETPVLAPPGNCFDLTSSGALLVQDPTGPLDLEPYEPYEWPFTLVSTACDGGGAGAGAPATPCSDPGRRMMFADPVTGALIVDPTAPFLFAETLVSCDGIAASQAAFDALDAMFIPTDYTIIPEPGAALSGAGALVTLAALARGRSRRRAAAQPRSCGPSMSSGRTQAS